MIILLWTIATTSICIALYLMFSIWKDSFVSWPSPRRYMGWEFYYLSNQLYTACKILKIPEPKLYVYEKVNVCHYFPPFMKNGGLIEVGLPGFDPYTFNINTNPYLTKKLTTEKQIMSWCLFHELAHHLQVTKFPKWADKYKMDRLDALSMDDNLDDDERCKHYREIKIEHNADKVASLLVDRLLTKG